MYRLLLTLCLSLFVGMPFAVVAQESTETPSEPSQAPLLAYFNDQLYQLDQAENALVPYDACTPDESIFPQFPPSPDGNRFLIPTTPNVFDEALTALGSLGDIPFGFNYWLCDTTTDTLERIIVQPNADDSYDGELPPIDNVQSPIQWSPDGTQLAWVQLNFETQAHSVTIVDIATSDITSFDVEIPPAPFPAPPEMLGWTEQGIILWQFTFNEETFFNVETLYVVDPQAEAIISEYEILNDGESADFYTDRTLVQTDAGTQLAIIFEAQGQVLVNLDTGNITPAEGQIVQTVLDSDDSLLLNRIPTLDFAQDWIIRTTPDTELSALEGYPPERIALSPDGTRVAYADSTLHLIDSAGTVTDIANSDGFADDFSARLWWGSTQFAYLPSNAETQAAAPSSCEGAPPIGARVGDEARVISTTIPNRIRSEPSTASTIAGEIAPRDTFTIIGGPACGEGYTWFQIQYGDIQGWTVEATGETYFIEPVTP